VPDIFIRGIAPKEPILRVTSPGCLDKTLPLVNEGVQTIVLPLTCDNWPVTRAFQLDLAVNDHIPLKPQIDADNRLLTIKLRSMELLTTPAKP
jgi:hypothetical protein